MMEPASTCGASFAYIGEPCCVGMSATVLENASWEWHVKQAAYLWCR